MPGPAKVKHPNRQVATDLSARELSALGHLTSWCFFTNPLEKICKRQIGAFPQVGVKIKNV